MQSFFQQDPRDQRANAKAKVDDILFVKLQSGAPGDDLIHAPFDRFEIPQGPKDLAADGRVVDWSGWFAVVRGQ